MRGLSCHFYTWWAKVVCTVMLDVWSDGLRDNRIGLMEVATDSVPKTTALKKLMANYFVHDYPMYMSL